MASLLAQSPAPTRILLTLPRQYQRFDCPVRAPDLPEGVEILWSDVDCGPALKALASARLLQGSDLRLIYCDDDWIYGSGWAAALLSHESVATTGQAWDIARLYRVGTGNDVAQGFSGVCVNPNWLAQMSMNIPDEAWAVDDIWLSAYLAAQSIPLQDAPAARNLIRPAYDDPHGLQKTRFREQSRHALNLAAAKLAHSTFGIWPAQDAA